MESLSASYTVPACNLATFQERIAALNKRARKLGVAEIATTVSEPIHFSRQYRSRGGYGETFWLKDGSPIPAGATPTGGVLPWHTLTVTGQAPKFDGWKFIATLEPIDADGEAINLLQCVPGESCPAEYRNRVGQCDHCNARRNRKQTFVVRHDNGQHKMVGRQCIRDFLGHLDPHTVASWAELLVELQTLGESAQNDEWLGGGGSGETHYDLLTLLAWTAGVIAQHGWMSRSQARNDERATATASRVSYLLRRPFRPSPSELREWEAERELCQPTDIHTADANAAREWALNFTDNTIESNNYLANCNAVARANYVISKTMGVACSILSSFQREQARLKLAERAAARSNEWVGKVGERDTFTVTVEKVMPLDGQWGETGLHKMQDERGNDLVWFASGSAEWLEVGKTYTVKASVKKHDDFKGRKQTNITRVKVM